MAALLLIAIRLASMATYDPRTASSLLELMGVIIPPVGSPQLEGMVNLVLLVWSLICMQVSKRYIGSSTLRDTYDPVKPLPPRESRRHQQDRFRDSQHRSLLCSEVRRSTSQLQSVIPAQKCGETVGSALQLSSTKIDSAIVP